MRDAHFSFVDEITGELCFPYYEDVRKVIKNDQFIILQMVNGKSYQFKIDSHTYQNHFAFINKKYDQQSRTCADEKHTNLFAT